MSRQHLPNSFQRCLLTSMQGRNVFSYLFDVKFLYSTKTGSLKTVETHFNFQSRKEGKYYEKRIVNTRNVIIIEREIKNIQMQDEY